MPSNERSAEWYRGAVAVLGRMVDECSTVFDSDLPHITQGNLEDYLAEYAKLLAAAEAREALQGRKEKMALSRIHGIASRQLAEPAGAGDAVAMAKICTEVEAVWSPEATPAPEVIPGVQAGLDALLIRPKPTAAEVIEACRVALEEIRAAVTTSTGQCGVLGTNWAECDYCGAVSTARKEPIPHEKGCAFAVSTAALALCARWKEAK